MRAGLLLTAIPGLAQQFNPVPREYMQVRGEQALVACPCGRRPMLERGELVACERALCWIPGVRSTCGRSFVFAVRQVLVFNADTA